MRRVLLVGRMLPWWRKSISVSYTHLDQPLQTGTAGVIALCAGKRYNDLERSGAHAEISDCGLARRRNWARNYQPGNARAGKMCIRDSMDTVLGGDYNPQNIYNMTPSDIHYQIADWALAGNTASSVGDSLFFFNPYSDSCPPNFPSNGVGVFRARVGNHCFYGPTELYLQT